MRVINKSILTYVAGGWLTGALFAFGATWYSIHIGGDKLSIIQFFQEQENEPLLQVVDLFSIVLTFPGYLIGRAHGKMKAGIDARETEIEEKMDAMHDRFRKMNKEIDDRRAAEKQLIIARDDAERAKRAEELFLANMSHELRTPLNGVVGFTRLLLGTKLDSQQSEYINTVQQSANHLLAIIDDILEISKIKAGEIEFEEITISPTKLIMNAVNTFKATAMQKNVALYEEIDRKIPPYILGDPTRLNQIFLNLISNAIKFTEAGRVVVTAKLVEEKQGTVKIKFSVEDTGIGIARERLHAIFEKFKQAENNTSRHFGGTGLGLAICKDMVELQGGKIHVASDLGFGSTFSFELTFKLASSKDIAEPAKGAIELKDIGNIHLLLVEDNKINVKLAEGVFKKWGEKLKYQVANNGQEAIDAHKEHAFNIILMDLQMPIMDGFEATKFIRENLDPPLNKVPIIALTADVMISEKTRAFQVGINDYITKPFDANQLFATIAKYVN